MEALHALNSPLVVSFEFKSPVVSVGEVLRSSMQPSHLRPGEPQP